MIEIFMVICALTSVSPYYDCDEKWVIVLEDTQMIRWDDMDPIAGLAVFADVVEDFPISESHPTITGMDDLEWLAIGKVKRDTCYDGICFPVLWHEMKHLMCDCNWHEDMVAYLPPGNF